jgi:hypothetical protein
MQVPPPCHNGVQPLVVLTQRHTIRLSSKSQVRTTSFFFCFGHHKNLKVGNYFKSPFDLVIPKNFKVDDYSWSSSGLVITNSEKQFVRFNSSQSTSRTQHIFNKPTISFFFIKSTTIFVSLGLGDNCYILEQGPFTN